VLQTPIISSPWVFSIGKLPIHSLKQIEFKIPAPWKTNSRSPQIPGSVYSGCTGQPRQQFRDLPKQVALAPVSQGDRLVLVGAQWPAVRMSLKEPRIRVSALTGE
jgi:hypothetical protein